MLAAPPSNGATSATILSRSLRSRSPYCLNLALSLCSTSVPKKKKMLTLSLSVVAGNSSTTQEYRSSWRFLCFRANCESFNADDWDADRCRNWSKNCNRPSKGSKGMSQQLSKFKIDRHQTDYLSTPNVVHIYQHELCQH